ncbi:MAG: EamA family transporter [Anaerolineales bacterium]
MKFRIAIAMLAIYLVWGSTYLAIRFAVETIPPFIMAGTRYLLPALLLMVWRRLAGDPAPTRRQWLAGAIVGLFLLLGGNGLVSWAEQRVESGIAALIVGTVPIWMVIFDAILTRIRPRWQVIVGLLTGFGGIIFLIEPESLFGQNPRYDLLGIGILVLAAFLWAIGSIYSRDADLPRSPLLGTSIEMLAGSGGLFIASLVTGEWKTFNVTAVSQQSLLGLLYLIVLGTLVGFVAYTWLLRNAPISLVSTYAYVNPLVAILLGSLLVQEPLNWEVALATAIIIGSVILINSFRRKPVIAPAE